MPKLGTAYVDVRARRNRLKPDLDQAHGIVKTTAKRIQKSIDAITFGAVALSAAAMATAIARSVDQSITDASNLQEATSKFSVVFAQQAEQAEQWSRTLVDSYAMSERQAKTFLSSIQDLLVPMGMNSQAAARMSNDVVKLAADLGSFNNLDTDKVMDDIQSALVGNYETMKKYGVVLNAASVEQAALNNNLDKTKEELTAADKAAAAYQLILESSTAAIGDMERTSDGYANTTKRLNSQWENFSATLGEKFLPAATKVKSVTADILENLTKAMQGPSIDEQIAATQAAMDKLTAEHEARNASRAEKRAAREKRHQQMVASFIKRNTGLRQTESAKVAASFDELNRKQLRQLDNMSTYERDLQYYQQRLDYLKDIQKLEQLSRQYRRTPAAGGDMPVIDLESLDTALNEAFGQVDSFYAHWDALKKSIVEDAQGPMGLNPVEEDLEAQTQWYNWQLEALQEHQEAVRAMEYEHAINRLSIGQWLMDALISEEGRKNDAIGHMQARAAILAVKNAEDALKAFGQQNRTAFEAYKAYKTSEATITGIDAAIAAWNAGMSTGGPWAPLVAAAYAASSLAWTGAQISQIQGMSYGGGAGGASSGASTPSVSSFATASGQSSTATIPSDSDTQDNTKGVVNIYVDGAINNKDYMIHLAEQLSALVEDYEVRLVASNAKEAEALS